MTPSRSVQTFRWHIVLTASGATLAFAAVAAAVLFVPLFSQFDRADVSQEFMAGVASYALEMHATFWPVILGSLLASVAAGTLLFERMKSPLVRFVRVFEAVGAGDVPTPFPIRKIDYLQGESDALNRMLESLAEREQVRNGGLERIEHALGELEAASDNAKIAAACAEIRTVLDGPQAPTDRTG